LVVEPAGRDAANTDHRRGQGSIRYVVTWGRSRTPNLEAEESGATRDDPRDIQLYP
jgi:hypothetical protein